MLSGIEVLCHNSIRIAKDKIIYIDPYKINREYKYIMYINVLMAMMMTAKGAEIKAKQLERQKWPHI